MNSLKCSKLAVVFLRNSMRRTSTTSKPTDSRSGGLTKNDLPVPPLKSMAGPNFDDDDLIFGPPVSVANPVDPAHSTADAVTHNKASDGITRGMNNFADIVARAAKLSVPAVNKGDETDNK